MRKYKKIINELINLCDDLWEHQKELTFKDTSKSETKYDSFCNGCIIGEIYSINDTSSRIKDIIRKNGGRIW